LCDFCDFISCQCTTWNFNHCTEHIVNLDFLFSHYSFGCLIDYFSLEFQFLYEANEWNHNFNLDLLTLLDERCCCFKDCSRLHFCDFRVAIAKTATELKKALDLADMPKIALYNVTLVEGDKTASAQNIPAEDITDGLEQKLAHALENPANPFGDSENPRPLRVSIQ